MRLVKMPRILSWVYPNRVWAFSNSKKKIYLTFDDGPHPEITPWVLNLLKEYQAKATFFCVGHNVEKHPDILKRIIQEGHTVGNHTFNHLNGRKTKTNSYIQNINKAQKTLEENGVSSALTHNDKILFRPPYGRISGKQVRMLQKQGYKIVMWHIVSYDFDAAVSKEKCLKNVLKNSRPGTIVVFHDSLKAEKNLRYALPRTLEKLSKEGFTFAGM